MPSRIYESRLALQGYKRIAGVDEAGRGPLAGPIVAAAVVLPPDFYLPGLDDSKRLSPAQRGIYFDKIKTMADDIGVAVIDRDEIDRLRIEKANMKVLKKAVLDLKAPPDFILIDGKKNVKGLDILQRAIVGGDGRCASIAAASIVAKVVRDRMMDGYHMIYPAYGFNRHKGYGTKEHFSMIKKFGACPIHRRSFALRLTFAADS